MLNKTVWLLWLQGWHEAPWLVRKVAESWEINNPDWNIEYVTLDNLDNYISDIPYLYHDDKDLTPVNKSDIIRLSLLKNHGGVWADATLLCMQPLTPWIEAAVRPAGLWMYHGASPGMRDKSPLLRARHGPASWFIASERDSLMIREWKRIVDQYWSVRSKVHDYFWLDFMFGELVAKNTQFREKWMRAPYVSCGAEGQSHMLGDGLMVSSDSETKKILAERPPYVLKLCWKRWHAAFPDVESPECKGSNGYFAIQMSKRPSVFKHEMYSKESLAVQVDVARYTLRFAKEKVKGKLQHLRYQGWRVIGRLLRNA